MKLHATIFARCLTFVALLCAFGLQLEVTHSHAHHEGGAECLACKSSSPATISLAPELDIERYGVEEPVAQDITALATAFCLYDSRGPPHLS